MLKKINFILNIVIGTFIGIFIGYTIYVCWDYKTHSDLYAMQSAPWYTIILIYGIVTFIILIVGTAIKMVIRKRME